MTAAMKLSAPMIWAFLGLALWLVELLTPLQVAGALGTAALGVALLSLVIPGWPLQFSIFLVSSAVLIWAARRYLTPKDYRDPLDQQQSGKVVLAITDGQLGRVAMGGTTWNAKSQIRGLAIPAGDEVLVVERDGNTLIVVPMHLLE